MGGREGILRSAPLARYTRSAPRTPRAAGPQSPEETRPLTFLEWWQWGVDQADAARESPIRLHDEDGESDVDAARDARGIVGWPFSVGFQRYLEEDWGKSPFRSAMASQYNAKRRYDLSIEYRILHALISGHTDADVVCAILGNPHRKFFEQAAVTVLQLVWGRGQLMKALAVEIDDPQVEPLDAPKKKFSLLCDGTCGRSDCAFAKDPDAPAGAA